MAKSSGIAEFVGMLRRALIGGDGIIICVDEAKRLASGGALRRPDVTRVDVGLGLVLQVDPNFGIEKGVIFGIDSEPLVRALLETRPRIILVDDAEMVFKGRGRGELRRALSGNRHVLILLSRSVWKLPRPVRDIVDFRIRIEDRRGSASVFEGAHASGPRLFRDKPSIGRRLARVQTELEELLRSSQTRNLIPVSLAVMSGLFDLLSRLDLSSEKETPTFTRAFEDYIFTWLDEARLVAMGSWFFGRRTPGPVVEPPYVYFILAKGPVEGMADYLNTQADRGAIDDESDLVAVQPFNVANWFGSLAMVARRAKGKVVERHLLQFLNTRSKISDLRRVSRVLAGIGASAVTSDEVGLHHPVDDTPDSAAEEYYRNLTPAPLSRLAHFWATDMHEIARLARKLRPRKGKLDRALLRRQNEAVRKGFGGLPGFREAFHRVWQVDFDEFCRILDGLALIAYGRRSDVAVMSRTAFVRRIASRSSMSPRRVAAVLRTLDRRARTSMFRPMISVTKSKAVTSYEWAVWYKMQVLESFFYNSYDFGLRGKVFEARCRKAFESQGFATLPPIQVRYPPDLVKELSRKLGFHKDRTDVDLLAHKDGVLLVCECKETKPGAHHRFRNVLLRRLKSDQREVALLAEYASRSQSNLAKIVGTEALKELGVPNRRLILVPLLIANHLPPGLVANACGTITYDQIRGAAGFSSEVSSHAKGVPKGAKGYWFETTTRIRLRVWKLAQLHEVPARAVNRSQSAMHDSS